MDLYTFYDTFLTALATDAGLEAWARENCGRPVTVLADLDFNNPPDPAAAAPYVLLHSPGKNNDQERRTINYSLEAWLVLFDDGARTRSEQNLVEPAAVKLMCDFDAKVEAAITAALPANFSAGYNIESDTVGMAPEIHGFLSITMTERLTIGADPLG